MKAALILADAAQTDANGKAHVLGLGWAATGTPTPPMSLVILIDCPWDQTNMPHNVHIELVDADGKPFIIGSGPFGDQPLQIDAQFEVGRPPGVAPGTPLRQVVTIDAGAGLPLEPGQKYEFRMSIDGKFVDTWTAAFQVRP